MNQDLFTPYREHMWDTFALCRYVVPATIACEINIEKFLQIKRTASRKAYYLQAVSRVLKHHPRVHASMVRKFWTNGSRIVSWQNVDAAVSFDKKFGDDRYPFVYVIRDADKKSLKELDEIIRYVSETPVEKIPEFVGFQKFLTLPRPVRKFFLHKMICDENLMRQKIGTFNFTNLSLWGVKGASLPTPRLLVGVSNPDTERKILPMGYSFNHVITDGAQIGEFHRDICRFFRKCEFE